jgi:cytochrome c556
MRRLLLGGLALGVAVGTAASASDDPILTRKKLMGANGAAFYGVAQGLIKGEIPFNPVVASSVFRTTDAVAISFGDYFPEGSDQGDTKASPKIWEEMAEFEQYLADFQAATQAALALDQKTLTLEQFQAASNEIGQTCQQCHEEFRLE